MAHVHVTYLITHLRDRDSFLLVTKLEVERVVPDDPFGIKVGGDQVAKTFK